ncbi:MAG: MmgE/PrpD family protein, partial [Alcaligenaceae bacterium]|nr:MmgE/PrpD family protein [Alcaligenaceae bacterium]
MQDFSATLSHFVAELRFDDIPAPVLRRTEDLLLDCLGSILAGAPERPVQTLARYARMMGPVDGPSENLVGQTGTSPLFAAMVNAAAAHMVEQDDVHNGSVFHPAAVVFPPALATAQALGRSGREFLVAAVAGYE